MPNPFKRGNSWTFFYYVKDDFGNRKQVWKGGYATKKEAEADLKIYKAKVDLGQITDKTNNLVRLSEYLQEWLSKRRQELQPNTVTGYSVAIRNHIDPMIGQIELRNLTPQIVQAFYNNLSEHLSAKTIQLVHSVLKATLKDAVDKGLLSENVCNKVRLPKRTKFKPKLLSQQQMGVLLQGLEGNKYETEIKLAMMLGLRRGEVLGIKEEDIDFEQHTLTICRQVSIIRDSTTFKRGDPYYGVKCLKSVSSNRVLYISTDIENMLRQRIEKNRQRKAEYSDKYNDNGFVCCNKYGGMITPQALVNNFKAALKKCGLPDMRFHDIRHSYATLCIDMNIPIKVVSQALGHSSTAITDAVYADSISTKRELANIISKAINPADNNE